MVNEDLTGIILSTVVIQLYSSFRCWGRL